MNNNLRQSKNEVVVTGVLKSKKLTMQDPTGNNGRVLRGNIVVRTDDTENETNDVVVNIYLNEFTKAGKPNGLFKGWETVFNEYKDIDTFDDTVADKIRVTGEIVFREYTDNQGRYVARNEYRGTFVNRLTTPIPFGAKADVEVVIANIKENSESGGAFMQGFAVGYGNRVIPIEDIDIHSTIYEKIKDIYVVGETVRIQCDLVNKAHTVKEEVDADVLFGSIEPKIITHFENGIVLSGGLAPYKEGSKEKYSKEEVEFMIQNRAEIKQNFITPAASDFAGGDSIFDNDDIPLF